MKFLVLSLVLCALVVGSSAQATKSSNIVKIQQAVGSILGQMSIIPSAVRQVIAGTDTQNNINKALAAIAAVQAQYSFFNSTYTSAVPSNKVGNVAGAFTAFKNGISDLQSNLKLVPIDTTKLTASQSNVETTFMNLGSVIYTL
uniref:Putative secreted peptide n=1 Tax=Anopheles braziliensis TaxID=58242 RepID=A0A2M3ZEQ8_9DIPT